MTNWYKNARPISLPQSMLPALTAVALSYGERSFLWIAAIASVLGVALLHLGLNLLDDWFDYRSGSAAGDFVSVTVLKHVTNADSACQVRWLQYSLSSRIPFWLV